MENATINFFNLTTTTYTTEPVLSIGGFIICIILKPLTSFVGLLSNGLTLFLLLKAKNWDTTDILFFALTFTDFLSLASGSIDCVFNVLSFIKYKTRTEKTFERFYPKLINLFGHYLTVSLSKPLIPLISAQRCSAVYHPLTFKETWTKTKTTILTLTLTSVVFAIGFTDGLFLALADRVIFDDFRGIYRLPDFIDDSSLVHFSLEFIVLFAIMVIYIVPIPLTIGLNIATIIGIKKSRQQCNSMGATNSRRIANEIELTKLLLIISLMFLVLNVPLFCAVLFVDPKRYDTFHVIYIPQSEVRDVICDFSQYLVTLNTTINCIVFVIKSSRYRETCLNMITCGLRRQHETSPSNT